MKKLIASATILIPILLIVQLVINNSLSTKGQELREVQNQITQVKEHNDKLHAQISLQRSLARISAQAEELGLIPVEDQISITNPSPLAFNSHSQ